VSKIGDHTNLIQSDIEYSINKDFSMLKELDLFSDGLDLLLSRSDNIIYLNNKLVNFLNTHDDDFCELENGHITLFNKEEVEEQNEDAYSGSVVNIDEIVLNKINDGKVILTEYVSEVIPSFSYDMKLEVLKDITNNNANSLSLLTDPDESDILIYQLKNILSDKYSIELNKLTKEEEKELQKSFFESISDNDTNIFDEIETNTFLHGLSYYKQVAQKNGMSITDLLFDDKNKDLFMNSINDIYNNSDQIDVLTESEMDSVKNYINETASANSISVNELLSNNKYSSILKGGINNED
jgi:hypothetical protein